MTGIAFDYERTGAKWSRRPWAASLDRIDSTKGYYFNNCRLVCVAINIALNAWGEDVLYALATGLLGMAPAQHPTRKGKLRGITRVASGRFSVRAFVDGKLRRLGTFQTQPEATRAYKNAKGFVTNTAVGKSV